MILHTQSGKGILATMPQESYLLAQQPSELERLRLQSLVWEPSGRQLLSKVGGGSGGRALDVGAYLPCRRRTGTLSRAP